MTKAIDKKRRITEGPIFTRLLLFSLPIMASGLLQVAYNMADNIVVGKFSDNANAIAAVGATGSICNLLICLVLGLSVGSSVVVSQYIGAKNARGISVLFLAFWLDKKYNTRKKWW